MKGVAACSPDRTLGRVFPDWRAAGRQPTLEGDKSELNLRRNLLNLRPVQRRPRPHPGHYA